MCQLNFEVINGTDGIKLKMNKSKAELIKYEIMPRHDMETVLVDCESYKFRKTPKLFLSNAGCSRFDATYKESSSGIYANQQSKLIVSDEDGKKNPKVMLPVFPWKYRINK